MEGERVSGGFNSKDAIRERARFSIITAYNISRTRERSWSRQTGKVQFTHQERMALFDEIIIFGIMLSSLAQSKISPFNLRRLPQDEQDLRTIIDGEESFHTFVVILRQTEESTRSLQECINETKITRSETPISPSKTSSRPRFSSKGKTKMCRVFPEERRGEQEV